MTIDTAAVLSSKARISVRQLMKLIGSDAFDTLMAYLERQIVNIGALSPTPLQKACRSMHRVLNTDTGNIDLDNPEVIAAGAALDMLVAVGAVSAASAQKIRDFVTACEAV